MANDQDDQQQGRPEDLGQDPFVQRRRPDPSQPPEAVRTLEGLLGDSDREGYKRLYFNRELDHYAEFRAEDVVFRESIPTEQPPLVGHESTRVGIRRDAPIEYTRLRTPRPVDEFDLDVRLAPPRGLRADVEEERFGGTRQTCQGRRCQQPGGDVTRSWNQNTCLGSTCGVGHFQTCGGEYTCRDQTCNCVRPPVPTIDWTCPRAEGPRGYCTLGGETCGPGCLW